LTKRPELIHDRLPADWEDGYQNVWIGVSVENSRFTWRVDELRAVPAAIRFVSAEPLVSSLFESGGNRQPLDLADVDWVIVGGESGPRSRRLELRWVDEILEACEQTGSAFFMKQLGTVLARDLGARDRKGGDLASLPEHLRRREMPVFLNV
jgi:protein gp37